jgi:hypothetical protein
MKPTEKAGILPQDVRDGLVAASKIRDPLQRQVAVQEATERAQRRCPNLYQTLYQPPKGNSK